MEAEEVLKLYKQLQENGIEVWIDGGWGIDVLLGKQRRPHNDLDIAIRHRDVEKLRSLLSSQGYQEKKRDDTKDWNFVLEDDRDHKVDVHTFEFGERGNNIYGTEYPKESLTGEGTINGQTVKCISPEYVIKFHANYEPKEKDLKDIKALCDKFGIEPPENYRKGR